MSIFSLTRRAGDSAIYFTATLHPRSLLACWLLLPVLRVAVDGPKHGTLRRVMHGVYSHPYTGRWAEQHFGATRDVDPEGLLLSVDIAWDKSQDVALTPR